jgi:23S rRNA (cytidine1920-2'-O)/16S rRNA (cytidine1409-2'-O)-methyltransferase
MRLDVLLVEKNFFPSREKAKLAITEGKVMVGNKIITKAGAEVELDALIQVSDNQILKYVSLGGLKLEKAIEEFRLNFRKKTVLDIGSSTGGFTDCALQYGASLVYAVDVGSEQLHHSLANHEQIKSFESQNIKEFELDEKVDIVVIDVSFTSQTSIFPHIKRFLKEDGIFVSLIKPQFELDQKKRFTNGIVTDKKLHLQVLKHIVTDAAQNGLFIQNACLAPVFPKKNTEFLAYFSLKPPAQLLDFGKMVK